MSSPSSLPDSSTALNQINSLYKEAERVGLFNDPQDEQIHKLALLRFDGDKDEFHIEKRGVWSWIKRYLFRKISPYKLEEVKIQQLQERFSAVADLIKSNGIKEGEGPESFNPSNIEKLADTLTILLQEIASKKHKTDDELDAWKIKFVWSSSPPSSRASSSVGSLGRDYFPKEKPRPWSKGKQSSFIQSGRQVIGKRPFNQDNASGSLTDTSSSEGSSEDTAGSSEIRHPQDSISQSSGSAGAPQQTNPLLSDEEELGRFVLETAVTVKARLENLKPFSEFQQLNTQIESFKAVFESVVWDQQSRANKQLRMVLQTWSMKFKGAEVSHDMGREIPITKDSLERAKNELVATLGKIIQQAFNDRERLDDWQLLKAIFLDEQKVNIDFFFTKSAREKIAELEASIAERIKPATETSVLEERPRQVQEEQRAALQLSKSAPPPQPKDKKPATNIDDPVRAEIAGVTSAHHASITNTVDTHSNKIIELQKRVEEVIKEVDNLGQFLEDSLPGSLYNEQKLIIKEKNIIQELEILAERLLIIDDLLGKEQPPERVVELEKGIKTLESFISEIRQLVNINSIDIFSINIKHLESLVKEIEAKPKENYKESSRMIVDILDYLRKNKGKEDAPAVLKYLKGSVESLQRIYESEQAKEHSYIKGSGQGVENTLSAASQTQPTLNLAVKSEVSALQSGSPGRGPLSNWSEKLESRKQSEIEAWRILHSRNRETSIGQAPLDSPSAERIQLEEMAQLEALSAELKRMRELEHLIQQMTLIQQAYNKVLKPESRKEPHILKLSNLFFEGISKFTSLKKPSLSEEVGKDLNELQNNFKIELENIIREAFKQNKGSVVKEALMEALVNNSSVDDDFFLKEFAREKIAGLEASRGDQAIGPSAERGQAPAGMPKSEKTPRKRLDWDTPISRPQSLSSQEPLEPEAVPNEPVQTKPVIKEKVSSEGKPSEGIGSEGAVQNDLHFINDQMRHIEEALSKLGQSDAASQVKYKIQSLMSFWKAQVNLASLKKRTIVELDLQKDLQDKIEDIITHAEEAEVEILGNLFIYDEEIKDSFFLKSFVDKVIKAKKELVVIQAGLDKLLGFFDEKQPVNHWNLEDWKKLCSLVKKKLIERYSQELLIENGISDLEKYTKEIENLSNSSKEWAGFLIISEPCKVSERQGKELQSINFATLLDAFRPDKITEVSTAHFKEDNKSNASGNKTQFYSKLIQREDVSKIAARREKLLEMMADYIFACKDSDSDLNNAFESLRNGITEQKAWLKELLPDQYSIWFKD